MIFRRGKIRKYSIICITQVYNELEKGNLKRFFKYIKPLVDAIVIYDDASTDGSFEYAKKQTPYVIRGVANDFANELNHRQSLINQALSLSPDFLLWLDADEVVTNNANEQLQKLCHYCKQHNIDGVELHEINLWRSNTWMRIDSLYNNGWYVRLWRVKESMVIEDRKKGLHKVSWPSSIKKTIKTNDLSVLHYGFSSDCHLAFKYLIYKFHGQRGYNMLDRLINEDKLKLKKVPARLFPKDLYKVDSKPQKRSFVQALAMVEEYREKVFRPKYSIICLIYKSVEWLAFTQKQIYTYTNLSDTEFYFVANDAEPKVLKYLRENYIPHYIWNNSEEHRKEWYINNVYRAYNWGAKKAKGDFLIFVNSDMALTQDWLPNLIKAYNSSNCVTARLVESGKLRSGKYGIEKNFGRDIDSFKESKFSMFAKHSAQDTVRDGGLFMPLFIRKDHFFSVGGYPEGNVAPKSDIFKPTIAKQGDTCISGDAVLMEKLKTKGIIHQTAWSAIVYHFQKGEIDSKKTVKSVMGEKKHVAICNDIATETMGKKVLWDFLKDGLPGAYTVDKRMVLNSSSFEKEIQRYIHRNYSETEIIIQNASYMDIIDRSRYTIAFLQDDLRSMRRISPQQERNLKSVDRLVTDSIHTALSYPEYDFTIIPIGVDTNIFKPMNKLRLRQQFGFHPKKQIGIFVGSLSNVKGWPEVEQCIKKFPNYDWILVLKDNETYKAQNALVFHRISQQLLAQLINSADFFILGSLIETQCMAALEACFCNVPVIMHNVGIFKEFTQEQKDKVGIITENLCSATKTIKSKRFSPRKVVFQKKLTKEDMLSRWHTLLERSFQEIYKAKIKSSKIGNRQVRKGIVNIVNDVFDLISGKKTLSQLMPFYQ